MVFPSSRFPPTIPNFLSFRFRCGFWRLGFLDVVRRLSFAGFPPSFLRLMLHAPTDATRRRDGAIFSLNSPRPRPRPPSARGRPSVRRSRALSKAEKMGGIQIVRRCGGNTGRWKSDFSCNARLVGYLGIENNDAVPYLRDRHLSAWIFLRVESRRGTARFRRGRKAGNGHLARAPASLSSCSSSPHNRIPALLHGSSSRRDFL